MIDFQKLMNWTGEKQQAFSARAGIDQGGLSNILNGKSSPSTTMINRVLANITPEITFINHSALTPVIVGTLLIIGQIDTVEHEPEDFNDALKHGLRIAVITDDKGPILALIKQALDESGLPNIPILGIKIDSAGKVEPWND